jgi:hypothetical protein
MVEPAAQVLAIGKQLYASMLIVFRPLRSALSRGIRLTRLAGVYLMLPALTLRFLAGAQGAVGRAISLEAVQFLGSNVLMVGPLSPPPLLRLTRMQLYRAYVTYHRRRAVIALLALVVFASLAAGVAVNLVPLVIEFGGRLRLPPVHALATAFYVLSARAPALTGESPSAGRSHARRCPELIARRVAGMRGCRRYTCPCPR